MSHMSNEAIQAQIEAHAKEIKEGENIKNSSNTAGTASAFLYSDSSSQLASNAVTASKPVYIDSSSIPQSGAFPMEVEIDGSTDTTFGFLNLTGQSSNSADVLMQGTLVDGSAVTTFTATGYLMVRITDSGGNLTDGVHYIQIGTLA